MELRSIEIKDNSELDYGEDCISFGAYSGEKLLGVIIFSPTRNIKGMMSLRHIFVDEMYRNMGVAGFMLTESEIRLKIAQIRAVCCIYDDYFDSNAAFFTGMLERDGFAKMTDERTMLRYEIGEIMGTLFGQSLLKMKKMTKSVSRLRDLSAADRISYRQKLKKNGVNVSFDGLDEDYSELYIADGCLCGMSMARRKAKEEIEFFDYYMDTRRSTEHKMMLPALLAKCLMTADEKHDISYITACLPDAKKLDALEGLWGTDHRVGKKQEFVKLL